MPGTGEAKKGFKQKVGDFFDALCHPLYYFSILSKDRYNNLKIRIVLPESMLFWDNIMGLA
jgi:hypothetical protein